MESYRIRLESEIGLNFIEFNYMLLQAYDFLKLFDIQGCRLQMGGSDQWGNIVAGIELIRALKSLRLAKSGINSLDIWEETLSRTFLACGAQLRWFSKVIMVIAIST